MKERTKEVLRDGFGSLVNNAAAIRGAKNGPFWLTLVMFILSLFLPIIPVFIAQANTNGSTFINTNTYNLERYIPAIGLELKNNRKVEFELSSDHELEIKEDGKALVWTSYGSANPFATYENEVTKQYDFVVYVSDANDSASKKIVYNAVTSTMYTIGTTTKTDDKTNAYTPSFMVLFKDTIYVVVYAANSTTALTSSYAGDFKTMKATNTGLTDFLKVTNKDGSEVAANLYDENYTNGVLKNFKRVLDKSYETLKVRNTWGTSGIYLAIFAGLSIVMGFVMWLLTRGKNNPNNYFTPWLTQKIEARLAFSPALITMIVGFFLTQYIPIAFILLIGLRVMWMSMKELRPIQN